MRFVLLSVLMVVSACGFRPVYGRNYQEERAVASAALAEIRVVTDTQRSSQLFKAELEDRLNPEHIAAEKRYVLNVSISETNVPLFVAQDGTYGRGNLQYSLGYTLIRLSDNQSLDSGNLTRVSSYAASETNAIYASHVAQQDARKRGMIELASDLTLRIGNRLDSSLETERDPE